MRGRGTRPIRSGPVERASFPRKVLRTGTRRPREGLLVAIWAAIASMCSVRIARSKGEH
jgi:hypothetical protein